MSRYLDVSGDPSAPYASGVSPETIRMLGRHGVVHVGYATFPLFVPLGPTVCWIGRTADASAFVSSFWWEGRQSTALWTLSEDGRIVVTEDKPRWSTWLRLAAGMRRYDRHGLFHHAVVAHDFGALVQAHEANLERHACVPLCAPELRVFFAMRLRYGEISIALHEPGTRVHEWVGRLTFVILSAAWVAASIVARERIGGWAVLTALAGALVAHQAREIGRDIGAWWVAPLLVRTTRVTRLLPAAALLERAADIPCSSVPEGPRLRLPTADMARLRRADTALALVTSVVLPAAGLVATLRSGLPGALAIAGAFLAAEGACELTTDRSLRQALRRRLLPRVVRGEEALWRKIPNEYRPPWFVSACLIVVGALLVAFARNVSEGPTSPSWFTAIWPVLATAFLVQSFADVRTLHDWVLPDETENPPPSTGEPSNS